jgi:tryptophanase
MDLVRLAIAPHLHPAQMNYVTEVVARVAYRACDLPGMRIVSQPRQQLRHFTARFQPAR